MLDFTCIMGYKNDMKILLTAINAKYIHSNPAVYSLKACAGEYADSVEIMEFTINRRVEEIKQEIYLSKPDMIAFSCYIWNIAIVEELLADLPSLLPGIPIWLGGPEVSFKAEEYLRKLPAVTGIMVGEGESTFREICRAYMTGQEENIKITPGIIMRGCNTGKPKALSMDALPFWFKELPESVLQNRIIYYESQRGCPYRCSYCLSSVEKELRFKNLDKIKEELSWFLDKRVPQVKFVDRTFNCKEEHALSVWEFIGENDNGTTGFHFEIAADILTEREIEVLSGLRPGLVQLEIGVQSTNQETLKAINRSTDFNRLWGNVEALYKRRNIHLHLDLIAGLPYEDMESFIHSFNEVYQAKPDELQLGFLKVLGGTEIMDRKMKFGIVHSLNPPFEVLESKWLSYDEIIQLKRVEEVLEIYYNSRQFENTISYLTDKAESPFAFYQSLAAFFADEGYLIQTPSRHSRYEILYEYVKRKYPEEEGMIKELLLHDMYLRENLKSRPFFAPAQSPKQEEIRLFFEKEETKRNFLPHLSEYQAKQLMHICHMEYYPVSGRYILYDYTKRNPLNNNGECRIFTEI